NDTATACARSLRTGTPEPCTETATAIDRKSTRLNSSHSSISYAVFCLKKVLQIEHLGADRVGDVVVDRRTHEDDVRLEHPGEQVRALLPPVFFQEYGGHGVLPSFLKHRSPV